MRERDDDPATRQNVTVRLRIVRGRVETVIVLEIDLGRPENRGLAELASRLSQLGAPTAPFTNTELVALRVGLDDPADAVLGDDPVAQIPSAELFEPLGLSLYVAA